jgi:hypothetical protein
MQEETKQECEREQEDEIGGGKKAVNNPLLYGRQNSISSLSLSLIRFSFLLLSTVQGGNGG